MAMDLYSLILTVIVASGCMSQECILPTPPANGMYVHPCSPDDPNPACRGVPGSSVLDGSILYTSCNQGFALDPPDTSNYHQSFCDHGSWQPPIPICVYNLTSDVHKCLAPPYPRNGKYNPLSIECALTKASKDYVRPMNTFVPSACVLRYSCNQGYELNDEDVISICDHGEWNPETITCKSLISLPPATKNIRNCVLPQKSEGRIFYSRCEDQSQDDLCRFPPGSAPPFGLVNVTCQEGYGLTPTYRDQLIKCENAGNWSPEIPKCMKLCPMLQSETTDASCFYGQSRLLDCKGPLVPGLTMRPECRQGYTKIIELEYIGRYERLTCQEGGTWDHPSLPECKPLCGLSRGNSTQTPVVTDGKVTKLGQFPWHAGIYRLQDPNTREQQWDNICGGSLISKKIILTAAHCVVDSLLHKTSLNHLRVALGKYYRSWTHDDEPDTIRRQVINITFPEDYKAGRYGYNWDLALLLLHREVEITYYIMPVCMITKENQVTEGATGFVVGWGGTEDAPGHESEALLSSNIDLVSYDKCIILVKTPSLLPPGNFCGVRTSVNTSVVQKGDSGGGVTVEIGGLHHIVGVVSTKIKTPQNSFISVLTNVTSGTKNNWLTTEKRKF